MGFAWPYRKLRTIQFLMALLSAFCIGSFFTLSVYVAPTFELKVILSRLRFLGMSLISPAGVLFISCILNRWTFLQKKWIPLFIFLPALATGVLSLNIIDTDLLTHSYRPFFYKGVDAVEFKTGPWFVIHYLWSSLLAGMIYLMLAQAAYFEPRRRKDIFILLASFMVCSLIDMVSVWNDSPLRWLMLSAGTFAISLIAILWLAYRNGLFGNIYSYKQRHTERVNHRNYQKQLLTLLGQDITSNSEPSHELLESLMEWSKTSEGKIYRPQTQIIELQEFLKNCIEVIKAKYPDKKVKILVDLPHRPFHMKADREMLASIIRNLLANALKASIDGNTIRIIISSQDHVVHFVVRDEGHGMNQAQMENLWAKDQGIGLALVRHLIELQNGQLSIKSTPGVGTQVYFSI